MLVLIEVFNKVNNVIGFEFTESFSQFRRGEAFDDLFADTFVEFGQDFPVHPALPDIQQVPPFARRDLFDHMGDVRRVQGIEQEIDLLGIARINSLENPVNETFCDTKCLFFVVFDQLGHDAPVCCPQNTYLPCGHNT